MTIVDLFSELTYSDNRQNPIILSKRNYSILKKIVEKDGWSIQGLANKIIHQWTLARPTELYPQERKQELLDRIDELDDHVDDFRKFMWTLRKAAGLMGHPIPEALLVDKLLKAIRQNCDQIDEIFPEIEFEEDECPEAKNTTD